MLIAFIISLKRKSIVDPLPPHDVDLCESPIERRVYLGLLQHRLHATPQYRLGRYRIDLAFPSQMVAIECDGKDFHTSPKQKAHDKKRDIFMQEKGWKVLRFSGKRIYRDLPGVVATIVKELENNEMV